MRPQPSSDPTGEKLAQTLRDFIEPLLHSSVFDPGHSAELRDRIRASELEMIAPIVSASESEIVAHFQSFPDYASLEPKLSTTLSCIHGISLNVSSGGSPAATGEEEEEAPDDEESDSETQEESAEDGGGEEEEDAAGKAKKLTSYVRERLSYTDDFFAWMKRKRDSIPLFRRANEAGRATVRWIKTVLGYIKGVVQKVSSFLKIDAVFTALEKLMGFATPLRIAVKVLFTIIVVPVVILFVFVLPVLKFIKNPARALNKIAEFLGIDIPDPEPTG